MDQPRQTSLFPDKIQQKVDLAELRERYLHLTKTVLPTMAQQPDRKWPVREDHCFQRIVLDYVCGGVWYKQLKKPAYKHMSAEQLMAAIELSEAISRDERDLSALNRQSLVWRGKRQSGL
ncbi:MAG: hypothetical protein AAF903_08135 [Pseudomonadota bacterium]